MQGIGSLWARQARAHRAGDARQLVIAAGALLVVANLALRAWALYPSWFYSDDYSLMLDAHGTRLDADYLLAPFNSHLMPGGRLLAWLVTDSGPLSWGLAATMVLVMHATASAGALWMLVTLFGARWATLAPLVVYLSSAMTLPAMMWWTAAVSQVPIQTALFVAVAAWVHYLRTRRLRWLVATIAAVLLGLAFDVRALLVVPVLVFLALAYFSSGSPLERLRTVWTRFWPAVTAGLVLAVGYLAYYRTNVPQPFTETSLELVGRTADTMLGTAFMSGVVGGPWRWNAGSLSADPPAWAVHLSWVLVVLVVLYSLLRRRRAGRAWALLAGFLVVLLFLLVTSRAPAFGATIGLEYRFLTDATAVVALCLGLAFLPVRGAVECSEPRPRPALAVGLADQWVLAIVVLVAATGTISSVRYVDAFQAHNVSDEFIHNLAGGLRREGAVDLADEAVPEDVMSPLSAPDNSLRELASLFSTQVRFPDATPRLGVVTEKGTLREALIGSGVQSRPAPDDGCGWKVDASGRTIQLSDRAFAWSWWLRVGYLGSQRSPVRVTAGGEHVSTVVDSGLNSLFVKMEGSFRSVHIDGLDPGTVLCVDTIEVGPPVAGGDL